MTQQYPFAIAFDQQDSDNQDPVNPQIMQDWQHLMQDIATATEAAGLPGLNHPRWEEFGSGSIFWGTESECKTLKRVLSSFPIYLQEERNLDAGYYSTPESIYYVTEAGEIFGFTPTHTAPNSALVQYDSIPLDAFKTNQISPELEARIQIALATKRSSPSQFSGEDNPLESMPVLQDQLSTQAQQILTLEQQVEQLTRDLTVAQTAVANRVDLGVHTALQQQATDQARQLSAFEQTVHQLQAQVEEWQSLADAKVDAEVYTALEQQAAAKTSQITALEAQVEHLTHELAIAQENVSQKVDLQTYEALQQRSTEQASQITEFEQTVQRLQAQAEEWQALANAKVEPELCETLRQQLSEQADRITDFEQQKQTLKHELSEWQSIATERVERADYEALLAKLQHLEAKQRQGWFARLLSWLSGK